MVIPVGQGVNFHIILLRKVFQLMARLHKQDLTRKVYTLVVDFCQAKINKNFQVYK